MLLILGDILAIGAMPALTFNARELALLYRGSHKL